MLVVFVAFNTIFYNKFSAIICVEQAGVKNLLHEEGYLELLVSECGHSHLSILQHITIFGLSLGFPKSNSASPYNALQFEKILRYKLGLR